MFAPARTDHQDFHASHSNCIAPASRSGSTVLKQARISAATCNVSGENAGCW
jgi:hypothetical protein